MSGAVVKKRTGRPSKCTPENAKRLCEAIGRGLPFVHACAVVSISFQTFSDWRSRDAKFREQIEQAIAEGISKRLAVIEKAAADDWRAAAFLLQTCPGSSEHFGRQRTAEHQHVHISGERVLIYLPEKQHAKEIENGAG
jgi:hypothetical protein